MDEIIQKQFYTGDQVELIPELGDILINLEKKKYTVTFLDAFYSLINGYDEDGWTGGEYLIGSDGFLRYCQIDVENFTYAGMESPVYVTLSPPQYNASTVYYRTHNSTFGPNQLKVFANSHPKEFGLISWEQAKLFVWTSKSNLFLYAPGKHHHFDKHFSRYEHPLSNIYKDEKVSQGVRKFMLSQLGENLKKNYEPPVAYIHQNYEALFNHVLMDVGIKAESLD